LGLNDLFGYIAAYLDDALIIWFPRARNTQDVFTRRNGGQDYATRTANTSVALIVHVNLRA